jgi:ATP-binding cassette subfamily C protein
MGIGSLLTYPDAMKRGARGRLKLLGAIVPKGQRAKWLAVAGLGLLVAAAESLAAILIALLVDAMMGSTTSVELPIVGDVSELLPGATPTERLRILAIGTAIFFLFKGGLSLAKNYVQARVAQNTGARIANRLFHGYLTMPYSFHIANNSAELMRNASWAADEVVSSFLTPLANLLTQGAMLIFLLAVLVATAPVVTLVTIAVLVPLVLLALRAVASVLDRLGHITKHTVKETLGSLQESLQGIRDIKVLGRERYFSEQFRGARHQLARAKYLYPTVSSVPSITIETLLVVSILGFVALGGSESGVSGASLPVLGLFAYAGLRMIPAMSAIVSSVNQIRYGRAAVATVTTNLEMIDAESSPLPSTPVDPLDFTSRLELEGVDFSYETGTEVLKGIDLVIHRGESVGIVGTTGAGKSTLLDLILGLLTPTKGRITVDGAPLEDRLRAWRACLGLVPQTIFLLDASVRSNIAYGIAESEIDEANLLHAVELAQLKPFIDSLPQGLDTMVGERGVRISGGQRQRVAIARALYHRPQVLIFDEGTAALDNLTEAALLRAVEDLRGEHTLITVAHRLTTVKSCDRIILIANGEIIDEGSYEDLRGRNVTFREMTG